MYRWLAGALVLLVAGLVFQLGLLAFSMYVLLLILPLSWWLTRCWMEHLDAARVNRDVQLEIGDRVAVELRIRNRWFGPVAWVLAEDHLPEHACGSGRRACTCKENLSAPVRSAGAKVWF